MNNAELNVAIPLFLGWQREAFPGEDSHSVIAKFGPETGFLLIQENRHILDHLDQIKPDWEKYSLASGSAWAVTKLKGEFPFLNEEATKSLEWVFSWWWK